MSDEVRRIKVVVLELKDRYEPTDVFDEVLAVIQEIEESA